MIRPKFPQGVFKRKGRTAREYGMRFNIGQHVLERWTKEYLPILQFWQKWQSIECNPNENDLVFVVAQTQCRNQRPLRRVVEV